MRRPAPEQLSPQAVTALLPPDERAAFLDRQDLRSLHRSWQWHARPMQRGPEFRTEAELPAWARGMVLTEDVVRAIVVWFLCGGRGSGKTRSGAEWCVDRASTGLYKRGALVGTTAAHIRDVMVEGESGLGEVCERRKIRMKYEPSKRRVTIQAFRGRHSRMTWTAYSAREPDLLAGPQHDSAWCEEIGSWAPVVDGAGRTTWDNLMLGLRLGSAPQVCVTATPRAKALIKWLLKAENAVENGGSVLVSRATLYDNLPFLAEPFVEWVTQQYPPGTRLGDQELLGLLVDLGGEMFRQGWWTDERDDGSGTRMLEPEDWFQYAFATESIVLPHASLRVRYWDLAATPETGDNDPDYTAGSLVCWDARGRRFVWEHLSMARETPGTVDELIKATAIGGTVKMGRGTQTIKPDPPGTIVYIENDRGQAGKSQVWHYQQMLSEHGIKCEGWLPSGDKGVRAALPSAWAEAGTLWMVRGSWNAAAWDQLEAFEGGAQTEHDDAVDSLSGAAAVLQQLTSAGVRSTSGKSVAEARIGGVGRTTWGSRLSQ